MPWYRNVQTGCKAYNDSMPDWGGEWKLEGGHSPAAPAQPHEIQPDEKPVNDPVREVLLPSARATVKQWVEFMAENGIEHPEDATKGEMSKIAITHFERGAK